MKIPAKLLTLLLVVVSANVFSQNYTVHFTLPQVALLDVKGAAVNLEFQKPTEAGNPIMNPSNNAKWINYTSAVASGGTRTVTAAISQSLPGIDIKLQTAQATGSGDGTLGTPSPEITLSTDHQTIISSIGGAYTGNGTSNGHQLTFSAVPNNYADITASAHTVIVTYTISDDDGSSTESTPVTVNGIANAITIPAITEAGNDYGTPTPNGDPITLNYIFGGGTAPLDINQLNNGGTYVKMHYIPIVWHSSLHLYAKRNGGSLSTGDGGYSGGTAYAEISPATDVTFFNLIYNGPIETSATVDYYNIPIGLQLGVSVSAPAATYTAEIVFLAED